jgi:hypothetical protein
MNDRKKKNCKKEKNNKLYCDKCGFKIGSKDHEQGEHHKRGQAGKLEPNKY